MLRATVLALCFTSAAASANPSRIPCYTAIREVEEAVSQANGELYVLLKSGAIDWDEFTDAQMHNVNAAQWEVETFGTGMRANMHRNDGSAAYCQQAKGRAIANIEYVMEPYRGMNATNIGK